jgi:hypothetical protein
VRSGDSKLREAVTKNDSSLISHDSLQLLTKTLSDWGNMVKSFGSSTDSDDDDDDEQADTSDAGKAAAGGDRVGSANGGNETASKQSDDRSAKEVWTSGEEQKVGNGEGGSPKDEQGDVAGGRSLGGDGDEQRQQQATGEVQGGEQVRTGYWVGGRVL